LGQRTGLGSQGSHLTTSHHNKTQKSYIVSKRRYPKSTKIAKKQSIPEKGKTGADPPHAMSRIKPTSGLRKARTENLLILGLETNTGRLVLPELKRTGSIKPPEEKETKRSKVLPATNQV